MKILHITKNQELSNEIKESIKDSYREYHTFNFEKARDLDKGLNYYTLLIIEADCESNVECEFLMSKITEAKSNLVNTIIIARDMSLIMKEQIYNKGVMAIIERDKFDIKRFRRYISSIEMQTKTVQSLQKMKIAVVDDSRFSLKIIKDFFDKSLVPNVDYYNDSQEFAESDLKYDLFIIDLVMPIYDGEDLIYKIREDNKESIIILVTQYGDTKAIGHCMSIGGDDFVLKPLDYKMFMLRLSSCIKNYNLRKKNLSKTDRLYKRATHDSLTGIFNRSYFKDKFSTELIENCKNGSVFSIVLFDIDYFKQINDEYGHQKGDEALIGITKLVSKLIRKSDLFFRWGGEEFLILLPGARMEEATRVSEKIRREIEKLKIKGIRKLTASFGVTQCKVDDNQESMFKRVDNSLYLAKLTGRNKVVYNEEIYIGISDSLINIDWGPFFKSGNDQIDKEHEQLISLSNEIISNCFKKDNKEEMLVLFKQLLDHVVKHFENEEKILEKYKYKEYEQHKLIHKDLAVKAKHMYESLESGIISPVTVVKYIVQDVVVGHIIKSDFDFFQLFNE